ncbi:hypothetical protein A7D16_16305 [Xanthomonas nasturtii]|nr:hypothetical protein A7D16_16305 [Xanthomonas nasturtii]
MRTHGAEQSALLRATRCAQGVATTCTLGRLQTPFKTDYRSDVRLSDDTAPCLRLHRTAFGALQAAWPAARQTSLRHGHSPMTKPAKPVGNPACRAFAR